MLRGHGHEESREEDEAREDFEDESRCAEEEACGEEGRTQEALQENSSEEVQPLSPTLSPLRRAREQRAAASSC